MVCGRRLLIAVAALLGAASAGSAAPAAAQGGGSLGGLPSASRTLEIAPAPAFVVDHEPVTPAEAVHPPIQGIRLLLLDIQHDATGEPTLYTRQVMEAAGYAGVSAISQLAIPFDPAYQRLDVNHVRVVRDGVVEDRQDRTHIDFLRREQGLEAQLVTGLLTASLRIDDVRAGDVVDVAFTIYGGPSSFTGRDARSFALALPGPVERYALRTRWPADVRWTTLGRGPRVHETRERGSVLLEVEPQAVEAIEVEELAPPWEPMVPYLSASSFGDWKDVAAWGRPFYEVVDDPAVAALAETIRTENAAKAAQVTAALRFVQREVRYLALTFGEGGYIPAAPGETLASRVGDCKAKVLLFLALMDELGIEAAPALVNSVAGRSLPRLPPSPSNFDHVIARVTLDGKSYWLDPTTAFQGGALDVLAQPRFDYALPLTPRAADLVRIEPARPTEPNTVIRETYDLTAGPLAQGSVRLEAVRTGEAADMQRAMFALYAKSDIEDGVVARYAAAHGGAELLAESSHEDDVEANRIVDVYEMRLEEPFSPAEEAQQRRFDVTAFSIIEVAYGSAGKERDWPLLLLQAHTRHELILRLPDVGGWNLDTSEEAIENAAFRYRRKAALTNSTYTVDYDFDTLADTLEPDQIDAVLEDQRRMTAKTSHTIWMTVGARAGLPDLELPEIDIDLAPPKVDAAPPTP